MQPRGGLVLEDSPQASALEQNPWVCIVWDDPINTTAYVAHVFATYFKMPRGRAELLMLQVHNNGKAVVASGTREEMERDVNAMQGYGLWATVEKAE